MTLFHVFQAVVFAIDLGFVCFVLFFERNESSRRIWCDGEHLYAQIVFYFLRKDKDIFIGIFKFFKFICSKKLPAFF